MLPVDVPWILRPWINHVRPRALIIVETEIWPNLIRVAAARHLPVVIINGRLSKRSSQRWRWVKPLIRHLLFKVNAVFTRGDDDARRFEQLGAPLSRVTAMGNTKIDNVDVLAGDVVFPSEIPILIGGSTWPGEEAMLASLLMEMGADKARLILAPRRLERVAEVRSLLEKQGLAYTLYSQVKTGAPWNTPVLLVDTLGDLKKLYSSAHVAFVGGSVFAHGGQNPLEPAAANLPVVFGPSMSNFRDEARGLVDARAAHQGRDESEVRAHLLRLMGAADERADLGRAAAAYIQRQRGASARVAQRLCELLGNT
jgi:3-deoxy-D-manno-octulosonic-acid transferase